MTNKSLNRLFDLSMLTATILCLVVLIIGNRQKSITHQHKPSPSVKMRPALIMEAIYTNDGYTPGTRICGDTVPHWSDQPGDMKGCNLAANAEYWWVYEWHKTGDIGARQIETRAASADPFIPEVWR